MRHDPMPVRTGLHGANGEFIRFYALVREADSPRQCLSAVFIPEGEIDEVGYFEPADGDFEEDDAWVHHYNWTSLAVGSGGTVVFGSIDDVLRVIGHDVSKNSLTFVVNTPPVLDRNFEPVTLRPFGK